jgi:hypothetical protein
LGVNLVFAIGYLNDKSWNHCFSRPKLEMTES